MSTHIQHIEISNFKSVRNLQLNCERVNVFIGKPNAGKSNILEAISLLGAGFNIGKEQFMDGFIRYKSIPQLFTNYDIESSIKIATEEDVCTLSYNDVEKLFIFHSEENKKTHIKNTPKLIIDLQEIIIKSTGKILKQTGGLGHMFVKKFEFKSLGEFNGGGDLMLTPPNGNNFYIISQINKDLRLEINNFLKPNGLEFLFDTGTERMTIVQKTNDSLISFPISLAPDTFQRYIFHLAAIFSNKNSVLLLEEPETHSYAPFVYQLAQHIINDDRNNQYFLTTHNPYLLTPIMQEAKDVAIFVTWFENYQTHARRLTEDEIREMLDYGVDIFLNLEQFIPA